MQGPELVISRLLSKMMLDNFRTQIASFEFGWQFIH
jgi:hypothetical protein